MVAQVDRCYDTPPTVPSWVSEMLPLSFDLAMDIGRFRRLMAEKLALGKPEAETKDFIREYLYVDENATDAIYAYFKEQHDYIGEIPTDQRILIEHTEDEDGRKYIVFHALFGRRVNDCLSRAIAFALARMQHRDVEMGISDNGFYLVSHGKVQPLPALKALKPGELGKVMALALDQTEVLRRRFRHCANRAMMILRSYMGHQKRVGRQQVSSMILMNAVKRISPDFCVLREARREVLEDLMDIENAKLVLNLIAQGKMKVAEVHTKIPSPFAFDLVLQGHLDILKIEDKVEFLKRMHQNVLAKISLGK
jgi:ATP-dependent Lhr-like helicase